MAPTFGGGYGGPRKSKTGSKKGQGQIMGKRRKVPKGYIIDNHIAAETIDESEGFGCSEVLCAPKRKCINLNSDNNNGFRVPLQNLPLSKMSQSERTYLESRLRTELEQVRIVQKRLVSQSSEVVDLSPYSDIRSCSDGQKRPPLESSQRSIEVSALQSKKRVPSGGNGPRTVGAAERQPEPVKQSVMTGTPIAKLMKQCETLLSGLMSHKFGWVFNNPVDVVKLNLPDYFKIIKHPMDLGTVKIKLLSGEYSRPLDFAADVRLTFSNAMTYNARVSDVYIMADTLRKYFEKRWKPIEKKLQPVAVEAAMPSRSTFNLEAETPHGISSPKKKLTSLDNNVKQELVKPIMSDVEKHNLTTELESLLAELPDTIIDFLRDQSFGASHTGEDEIEIDIEALNDDTLFKLRKLLDDYLLAKQKKQEKAEPCEMELHNESGLSNSSVQLCKVSDPVVDVVDIVGNDPPISSYPPIEIQKDAAHRNSKCSSSSTSSSESGSSCTDSDLDSSDSEDDGPKVSYPPTVTKDILNSGVTSEQKTSDLGIPGVINDSLNGLSEVEQTSQSKSVGAEADGGRQEGEIAPSDEREVSPNKLYRAALLRNRFADTILKAQEKTLDKGKKQDPEKLRLEKEELERRRNEGKARLQAEAKAAEEAQRKAEAEAAVELKRKRESEREAARQALQKMEKTVDINVDCQFLKDLEMLGSASDEQLDNFVDETSPNQLQNGGGGMGSFKLNGSNPLEQLGLYMKVDEEEEEEEGEPREDVANDPEEGEVD